MVIKVVVVVVVVVVYCIGGARFYCVAFVIKYDGGDYDDDHPHYRHHRC